MKIDLEYNWMLERMIGKANLPGHAERQTFEIIESSHTDREG